LEEYENPYDRRFHAQSNCCPVCGPIYTLADKNANELYSKNPVLKATEFLKDGKILAVKGIGGYHLVCDATNESSVKTLRIRKSRPYKPFAIMAGNISAAEEICHINSTESKLLKSNKCPIVLLYKKENTNLADIIAPNLKRLGVMLPYTPLHCLLFCDNLKYLVMTSGNKSRCPICYKDEDALESLSSIADYFLIHNREIVSPVDDSVTRVVDNNALVSRIGRGYAPLSIKTGTKNSILALGAEQKASVCITNNGYAHISQYLGDLGGADCVAEYKKAIKRLVNLYKAKPEIIAFDMHPGYFSAIMSKEMQGKKIAVQHHHAHLVSCMAENGLSGKTLGVIFDGTGYGNDKKIWGGEFLIGDRRSFFRAGHLEYVPLQGGDMCVTQSWRTAVCYLHKIKKSAYIKYLKADKSMTDMILKAIENRFNCIFCSSMGRLFDCVSALINLRDYNTYDAQSAIELENIADTNVVDSYLYLIKENKKEVILRYKEILNGVLCDLEHSKHQSYISAKFHNTIRNATLDCIEQISKKYGINNIVLSGGVFENTLLLNGITEGIRRLGLYPYYNKLVPINDGGISFGQAAVAAEM